MSRIHTLKPQLTIKEKKKLLSDYVSYYKQRVAEHSIHELNVKIPKEIFVSVFQKIDLLLDDEIRALSLEKTNAVQDFLDANPLPDCLETLLPREFRIYSLLVNALKQWISNKSAETDRFLLGCTARKQCREAVDHCIITGKSFIESGITVELHHPMRDGRPPLPLSKEGHAELEEQLSGGNKNNTNVTSDSVWKNIRQLRKERNQSWIQLAEGCRALYYGTPCRARAKSFANTVIKKTGLSPQAILSGLEVQARRETLSGIPRAGIGAIIGDIVDSPYEFDHNNIKTEQFSLFSERSKATDDTIMRLAVAEGLVNSWGEDEENVRQSIVKAMQCEGTNYPNAGYGVRFNHWLRNPVPYGSFGNGSAMRVSAIGWLFDQLSDVLKFAALTADVSHNHLEGIKGAQATAAAIYLTRCGLPKNKLKDYLTRTFGYDLNRKLDEIRPTYHHVESCQQTVPEAIIAYLEGQSFEDVLRKAVSLGGDSDTLTAIAASIAEARYPIPDAIRREALSRLDSHQRKMLYRYEAFAMQRRKLQRETLERLFALIPSFTASDHHWGRGEIFTSSGYRITIGEGESCDEIMQLVEIVNKTSVGMPDYLTLWRLFGLNENTCRQVISEASALLLRAMLTFFVRRERFCWGTSLVEEVKNGLIGEILVALKEWYDSSY